MCGSGKLDCMKKEIPLRGAELLFYTYTRRKNYYL
jgi:hypothetical protein